MVNCSPQFKVCIIIYGSAFPIYKKLLYNFFSFPLWMCTTFLSKFIADLLVYCCLQSSSSLVQFRSIANFFFSLRPGILSMLHTTFFRNIVGVFVNIAYNFLQKYSKCICEYCIHTTFFRTIVSVFVNIVYLFQACSWRFIFVNVE